MITLLKQIAIRDRSNYANSVILTNVMEGVDGSATFGYSIEPVAIQVEDNQTQQYKHVHTFDIRVIEESGDSSVLDALVASQQRVDIAGLGVDGYFQFDNVLLTRNKQYDGILASAYLATAETLTSYTTNEEVIYAYYNTGTSTPTYLTTDYLGKKLRAFAGRNLYDIYNLDVSKSNISGYNGSVWQNGTYRGLPNDVNQNQNIVTSNVIGSNVELTRAKTSIAFNNYEKLFIPFTDQTFTATINVTNIYTDPLGDEARLRVHTGYPEATGTTAYDINLTTVGRKSFDFTIPVLNSNTLSAVIIQVRPGTASGSTLRYDDIGIYVTGTEPSSAKTLPTTNTNATDPLDV